ncbi:hypothetical protein DFH27DRAFT_32217 [Peziza echinospora]|nr:hypothetical protein DFH27DRAFT_32217 [Peziza echinospora]
MSTKRKRSGESVEDVSKAIKTSDGAEKKSKKHRSSENTEVDSDTARRREKREKKRAKKIQEEASLDNEVKSKKSKKEHKREANTTDEPVLVPRDEPVVTEKEVAQTEKKKKKKDKKDKKAKTEDAETLEGVKESKEKKDRKEPKEKKDRKESKEKKEKKKSKSSEDETDLKSNRREKKGKKKTKTEGEKIDKEFPLSTSPPKITPLPPKQAEIPQPVIKKTVNTNWQSAAADLQGGDARQSKFLRLLGAKSAAPITADKKNTDVRKREAELEQQFNTGLLMKSEPGKKRRGLGA